MSKMELFDRKTDVCVLKGTDEPRLEPALLFRLEDFWFSPLIAPLLCGYLASSYLV